MLFLKCVTYKHDCMAAQGTLCSCIKLRKQRTSLLSSICRANRMLLDVQPSVPQDQLGISYPWDLFRVFQLSADIVQGVYRKHYRMQDKKQYRIPMQRFAYL